MKRLAVVALLPLFACDPGTVGSNNSAVTCSDGETPIYANRFVPQAGASGVATGSDAQNGMTSSAPQTPVSNMGDSSLTAMTVSCGHSPCAAGQVAIEIPPALGPVVGGIGDAVGGPSTMGGPTPTPSPDAGAAMYACAAPPPSCPAGLSPQYTMKKTWDCTDCTIVVTYGGAYGNYRRCASLPTITCETGQVPTWVFEDEAWECKKTCDNGQYDQHTIGGILVCVPC